MDGQPTTESILQRATGSLKWSALMEVVSRTASPIITVILAHILSPADFGVVATAMIAISFAQMFWDAGLSKALVQTNESPEGAAHIVFWTNLVLGLAIYTLLFVMAPAVAVFFKSPGSGPVLRVMGLQIVIASLSSVQQALLVRELDFHRLFRIKLLTGFLPGLFSIPLAFQGFGVWALVAGALAGQTLNLILLWRGSPWRPRLEYPFSLARRMFKFGVWVIMESFGGWLIVWGDSVVVGRFLGIQDLGVYRTGWMLVTAIFGLALNPFLPVLYPTFSRLQGDLLSLKDTFHKVNRVIIALALPMGVGLLLVGPEVADVLFGSKWQGLGFVLGVLGLMFGLAWLVGVNPELYRAMARPDVNTKLLFIALLYYMPAYYLAAQSGLKVFVYTRLGVAVVALPIHIYLCRRLLKVPAFYLWHDGKGPILAVIAMGAGISIAKWSFRSLFPDVPQLLTLALLVVSGACLYVTVLWIFDRAFILQTSRLVRRAALT